MGRSSFHCSSFLGASVLLLSSAEFTPEEFWSKLQHFQSQHATKAASNLHHDLPKPVICAKTACPWAPLFFLSNSRAVPRAQCLLLLLISFSTDSAPFPWAQDRGAWWDLHSPFVQFPSCYTSTSFQKTPLNIFLWNNLQQKQDFTLMPFLNSAGSGSFRGHTSNHPHFMKRIWKKQARSSLQDNPQTFMSKNSSAIEHSPLLMRENYYNVSSWK